MKVLHISQEIWMDVMFPALLVLLLLFSYLLLLLLLFLLLLPVPNNLNNTKQSNV